MKVVFICGSLDPGSDGVGDYTRRLSGALIKRGIAVELLALYDRGCRESKHEYQISEGSTISVTRYPRDMQDDERYMKASAFIQAAQPTWISIQFVIFTYNPKGLPFKLSSHLKKICADFPVHIMFHELWVGMEEGASFKHRLVGFIQKRIIAGFISATNTKQLTTHTPLYKWQLANIGYTAQILPLIGNVPKAAIAPKEMPAQKISVLFFGGIHHGAPIETFLTELKSEAGLRAKPLEIVFIGKCGSELKNWMRVCESLGIEAVDKGIMTEAELSRELSAATFGVSTTPYVLSSKSGTVAAMKEHGLKVLCVARNWNVSTFNVAGDDTQQATVLYTPGMLKQFFEAPETEIKFVNIVDRFVNLLHL